MGDILLAFIGIMGTASGITTFIGSFGLGAGSVLAAPGTGGASLAGVAVSVEGALAGTAIASGSLTLAGTAFASIGKDLGGFERSKGTVNFKWGNPNSVPTYGHTFSDHGAKLKPTQLIDRARALEHQVGKWLDNQKAADFLSEVAKRGPGVHDVSIPEGVKGISYLGDGTELVSNMARVIVKENGAIRTAFPYNSNFPN